jgi:hypothetical protein
VTEIEDYRCTLPLSGEDDIFPIGFGLSFNTKSTIDFGNFGKQPQSPLLFILTDTGLLVTFFAINLDYKNKSICYESKQMAYKPQQAQNIRNFCFIYSL